MLPVIALVGRPNVGKSTLFNFLTRTRDALVADLPGLTRDRNYGYGKVGSLPYVVVDTGGLVIDAQGVEQQMVKQALRAVEEADRVLFLVDSRSGITPDDHYIAQTLRKLGKKVFLAANKAEGVDSATAGADFYALGLGEPRAISAQHGDNVRSLVEEALEGIVLPEGAAAAGGQDDIRVAVIGRPNVGKSTLINRLLGEERLISFDQPGTTRDAVFVPFERDGHTYTLIDTAGVRRRARVEEAIEKFSVIKALQAVDSANVVIGVIDAHDAVTEQDASLFGMVAERGRALLIAVNKWDGIHSDKRDEIRAGLDLRLPFLDFAPVHFISALHGTGVGELMRGVKHAYDASMREMATPELTRVLETAMEQHQPPLVRGRRIKLRYAHQGGRNPPIIVVHGNQIQHVPDAYKRYLANVFRKTFKLEGTPVRVQFRADDNPFKGKRNPLTPRQRRTEKRNAKRSPHKKT
ncbi:ribosome biogenesis GTPase Der [Steroidobacter sp.]|uniref:ribosome biogenesis GTPase Der n=1 Tax=Steroidobacter sp. TaxID=1978227 RepID=UPI001A645288|nr:ribosome biogenesis GTPase Der [Steroidobacter sp.]MBL8265429.1 ribosome biogenesis GTPase Der [Steroidobacter sp.]